MFLGNDMKKDEPTPIVKLTACFVNAKKRRILVSFNPSVKEVTYEVVPSPNDYVVSVSREGYYALPFKDSDIFLHFINQTFQNYRFTAKDVFKNVVYESQTYKVYENKPPTLMKILDSPRLDLLLEYSYDT